MGVGHTHRQSVISAFTLGFLRDVASRPIGTFAVGADVTGYRVPGNLQESYGSPVSFHIYFRYIGRAGAHMDHGY